MKKPIQSRTIWINAATLIVGVIGYLVGQDLIADNASLVAMLVAVQGTVNIALRLMTNKAIG
jgi:hypothetical protein